MTACLPLQHQCLIYASDLLCLLISCISVLRNGEGVRESALILVNPPPKEDKNLIRSIWLMSPHINLLSIVYNHNKYAHLTIDNLRLKPVYPEKYEHNITSNFLSPTYKGKKVENLEFTSKGK